jgi:hypothetical protein
MPNSNTSLELWRRVALYFTMTVAVLMAVGELVKTAGSHSAKWLNTAESVLLVAIIVGGVAMGVLYLVHLSTKKRASLSK